MPRRLLGVAVTGTLAATGLAAADRDDHTASKPVMRDEFNGGRLDKDVWARCHWWANHGCTIKTNHELEWYLPGQVTVRGGVLRLTAERRSVRGENGKVFPYASGMVSSGPTGETGPAGFAFRYGLVEARVRVPHGRGLWPALWLLPVTRSSKPEIDVMEIKGQEPETVHMHLHYLGREGRHVDRGHTWSDPGIATGWHRFGIDWRPRLLRWLIDGKERFRVTGSSVPAERMYLVANLAVGGDWPGPPDKTTRFPSVLKIDYVRVWK